MGIFDFGDVDIDRSIEEIDRKLYDLSISDLKHISMNKKIYVINIEDIDGDEERSFLTYKNKKSDKMAKVVITNRKESTWNKYKGEWVRVIGAKVFDEEVGCDWMLKYIFSEKIYNCLCQNYDMDYIQAVNNSLYNMPREKMNFVISSYNNIKNTSRNENIDKRKEADKTKVKFSGIDEIKTVFNLLREYYPNEVRTEIESCISIYKTPGTSSDDKNAAIKVLRYLINIDWNKKISMPDIKKIRQFLDKNHYGLTGAKDEIIDIVSDINRTGKVNTSILLVGNSGCGKTSYGESIAEALCLPVAYIDVAGANDSIIFRGSSRNYSNGNIGMLFRKLNNIDMQGVLLLDNIDAVTDGEIKAVINELLGNRTCEDEFLEMEIPLDNVLIIGITKNTENISSSAIEKSKVIHMDAYSHEEKQKIATDYILPKLVKDRGMEKDALSITAETVEKIVEDYALSNSISSIYSTLKEICVNAKKKKSKHIEITLDNLGEYLELANVQGSYDRVRDINSMMNFYLRYKKFYPDNIRNKIENLYDLIKSMDEREHDRQYYINCFYLLTGIRGEASCDVDVKVVMEKLDATHYGLDKVKRNILKAIIGGLMSTDKKLKPILLDGCPGIGKTTIAKTIAQALEMSFVKVPLNGIGDVNTITGFTRSYSGSDAGIIVKGLYEAGRYRTVMLLDELDKMSVGKEDPYAPLHNLLDGTGGFYDKYLEVEVPTEDIFFICTSNDKSKIPTTILDRLQVIELEGYTSDEKSHIAKEYIIPKILKNFSMDHKIEFTDEIVGKLLKDYCTNYGVRDVERAIDDIICDVILDEKVPDGEMYTVQTDDLKEYLGAANINDMPENMGNQCGCATALAVSGNTGTTFQIQAVENPYGKDLEVTGLPQGSTNESIYVAMTLASKILDKNLPKLHIHFTDAGIKKDGPSAGVTIFASLMSLMLNKPTDNVAFTGEIDLFGAVLPVGGVKLKLIAAEKAGVKRVFIPAENYRVIKEENEIRKFDLEIVPVKTVSEIIEELFKEKNNKVIV